MLKLVQFKNHYNMMMYLKAIKTIHNTPIQNQNKFINININKITNTKLDDNLKKILANPNYKYNLYINGFEEINKDNKDMYIKLKILYYNDTSNISTTLLALYNTKIEIE